MPPKKKKKTKEDKKEDPEEISEEERLEDVGIFADDYDEYDDDESLRDT